MRIEANFKFPFYEFFAGGGLARLGLGEHWECLFANDIDPRKGLVYRENFFGAPELFVEDIRKVQGNMLPGYAVLSWASFPCQDLSLAGKGGGLGAERSGTFWPFWELMLDLDSSGRAVPIVVLENVVGLLTSKGGKDFEALCRTLARGGYRFGAVVMDAVTFLPQSRPRLFIVAVKEGIKFPDYIVGNGPDSFWHGEKIRKAYERLEEGIRQAWIWWNIPLPPKRSIMLRDVVEMSPNGVAWDAPEETERLLSMMSPVNLAKVQKAQILGKPQIGTVYKRTRVENGERVQRAEVRFDGVGGCLRTPAGGSSRQTLLVVEGSSVRSRLISPREMARLMGLPEYYRLPERYNDSYHLLGDAVAVPVVSWLEEHVLFPLAKVAYEALQCRRDDRGNLDSDEGTRYVMRIA